MPPRADRLFRFVERGLKIVLGLGSFAFVGVVLATAALRLAYPFELEWMEGAVVDHVCRILDGRLLYVAPTVDFVPFRYTPLYYYVSAALCVITGPGFFPLRLVSILGALLAMLLLYLFVKRETGRALPGLISAGLFAAAYPVTGYFYDLARVDSLFIALLLSAAYVFRFDLSTRGAVVSGVLFALAFLTKQAAGPVAAAVLFACLFVQWRRAFLSAAGAIVVAGGASLAFNLVSDGWFYFYAVELGDNVFTAQNLPALLLTVVVDDLLRAFPIAAPVALAALVCLMVRGNRYARLFYAALALGLIAIAFIARVQPGGWTNTLIPACVLIALLFGLGLGRLEAAIRADGTAKWRAGLLAAYLLAALQLTLGVYNPSNHVPAAEDKAAGRQLIERLAAIPGDVYLPYHGYYASMAGKRTWAHFQAIRDVWSSAEHPEITREMTGTISRAIRGRRFAAIVLDGDFF